MAGNPRTLIAGGARGKVYVQGGGPHELALVGQALGAASTGLDWLDRDVTIMFTTNIKNIPGTKKKALGYSLISSRVIKIRFGVGRVLTDEEVMYVAFHELYGHFMDADVLNPQKRGEIEALMSPTTTKGWFSEAGDYWAYVYEGNANAAVSAWSHLAIPNWAHQYIEKVTDLATYRSIVLRNEPGGGGGGVPDPHPIPDPIPPSPPTPPGSGGGDLSNSTDSQTQFLSGVSAGSGLGIIMVIAMVAVAVVGVVVYKGGGKALINGNPLNRLGAGLRNSKPSPAVG